MICIPIDADQPLVAHRITQLDIAISLDFTKMTSDDVRRTIHKIFNEKSYYEKINIYTDLSKKHNGYANASKLISDLIYTKKTLEIKI